MANIEEERRYYDSFIRARPDLALAGLEHVDKPDFLGTVNSTRVGIEVTRFTELTQDGAPRPEEQESLQHRTMVLARDEYRRLGGPPLHVHAAFTSRPPLSKRRMPELASEIAAFLKAQARQLVMYDRPSWRPGLEPSFLPEIQTLRACRVPTEGYSAWYAGRLGLVRHAGLPDVARAAAPKEERISGYRGRCDEVWLLIVFDVRGSDTYVRQPVAPVEFSLRSGFDRIFCLAPVGDACVEIPVTSTFLEPLTGSGE